MSTSDSDTTLETLKDLVRRFATDRDWARFHTPKNLALSIAVEAAEILEHFQWIEAEREQLPPEKLEQIGEECADVLAYLLGLVDRLDIDLSSVFRKKMIRNAEKYPAEQFKGRYGYDDPELE